jgi:NAD+ diphosphatase
MPTLRGDHVTTPMSAADADRDALRRASAGSAEPGPDARFVVTRGGAVSVQPTSDGLLTLALEEADPRRGLHVPAVFLGTVDGLRLLAVEIPEPNAELDDPGRDLRDLRRVVGEMGLRDAGHALTAVAMGAWHHSMKHCPMCGALLAPELGGWVLRCSEDGSEHFPRTDPAVIMALRDQDDRLLLARNANFRGAFHSVLAGFVEPGEDLEDAVAREVAEEVGMTVTQVQYVGSQPWPFPRSLMIGYRAWCENDHQIVLADGEIASARWFTRDELAEALASGEVVLPNNASIGRALIVDWYGTQLPDVAE